MMTTVTIPKDAKTGGYWCALIVDEVMDPLRVRPEGVGVRFLASLSIGVFVYALGLTLNIWPSL